MFRPIHAKYLQRPHCTGITHTYEPRAIQAQASIGGDPDHMAEAAKQVVDWVAPDFIDLNFGCPVNKVVAKNGGSALLKDCPTLTSVARAVVQAVAMQPVPVDRLQIERGPFDDVHAARRSLRNCCRSITGSRSGQAVPGEALNAAIFSVRSDGTMVARSARCLS